MCGFIEEIACLCYDIFAKILSKEKFMIIKQAIEILGHDDELKTIFAKGVSGSIVLDIIPEAVIYLTKNPKYKQLYMQDYSGREIVIPQGSSIEEAVQLWQDARHQKSAEEIQNYMGLSEQACPAR